MLRKIIDMYKLLNEKFKIDIIVSANTFYTILLIIPLNNIGFNFFEFRLTDVFNIFAWGLIFLLNMLFVGTKYLVSLKNINNYIKPSSEKNSVITYLKYLAFTFIIVLLFVTLIIISFGIIDIWTNLIGTTGYTIVKLFESVVTFLIVTFIVSVIYKFVINIEINHNKIWILSGIIVLIWEVMSTIYQNIIIFIRINNLQEYETALFLTFIYLLNYFIILTFFYNYWNYQNELKEKEREKYIEH